MLNRLKSLKNPIRVGIIGAGTMGKSLLYQCGITPGIQEVALADVNIEKAVSCANAFERKRKIVGNEAEMCDSIKKGPLAITADGLLIAESNSVDVLIEASTSILEGANFVIAALKRGKTVILMNAEVDLMFSPYFQKLAWKNDTVCTSCDGDQYGVLKYLIDNIRRWGFQMVLAGNIKGFLDHEANPTSIIPEADKRGQDHRQCVAMTDGTKLNIEMSILANAFGLKTDIPGMRGPKAKHVKKALKLFDLDRLRQRSGIVDYLLGAEPSGGVFVIGYCNSAYQKKMLSYYKMGDGPYYLFYQHCHLCHIEAMKTVASAFLDRETFLYPKSFKTNVFACAKKPLKKNDVLDGLGGYAVRGVIKNCLGSWENQPLPIVLSKGLTLKKDIQKGQLVWLEDVDWDPQGDLFRLYAKAQEL